MNSLKIQNAQKGRVVFVKDGKEVSEGTPDAKARINGPHTEAKWAKDLLGTNETPTQNRLRRNRERCFEIVEHDRKRINEAHGKFTSKPKIPAPERIIPGQVKATKKIKAPV